MVVRVVNESVSYVNRKALKYMSNKVMRQTEYPNYRLSIAIVDNAEMREMNRIDRGKDKPTDILSYPFYEELKRPGLLPKKGDTEWMGNHIGECIISLPYLREWCDKRSVPIAERTAVLLVHGVVHLMGYDHETVKEYKQMAKLEKVLLKKYYKSVGKLIIDPFDESIKDVNIKKAVKERKLQEPEKLKVLRAE